jgi:hypothetical protein
MGWGLLRTRDSTLVNATRSRQVWTRLYLDENEEEKRRGEERREKKRRTEIGGKE